MVKVKGQGSIFRRYACLKTFTTRCHYISSWPWPLTLILISIIACCFVALRLVVFIFSIFRDCDLKKRRVFVFCRFASICNTENIREGQSQLLGPFRQWSEKHRVFPSSAGKVREVAIAWRFRTWKYRSFWLVAIANYKSYASIVSKLVVFPKRMAYCGLIIFHESRTTSMKALRWVAKQKCHLRKENYIHVCNFNDKQNKRSLYCGVKTL